MKCYSCEKGKLVRKKVIETIGIEGGPTLKIKNIEALECDNCGERGMDALNSSKSVHLALAALVAHYSKSLEIPGKVSKWMREAISLKLNDWAEKAKISHSALSVAATRNTIVDKFAAFALLCLVSDYLSGTNRGGKLLEETTHLEDLVSVNDIKAVEFAVSA